MATKGMADYTVTLDGVNAVSINVAGDFVHVQEVSVGGTKISIQADVGKAHSAPRRAGQSADLHALEHFRTQSHAQPPSRQATDTPPMARANVNATITAPVEPAVSNPAVAAVTVTAGDQVELIAADGDCVGVLLAIASDQPGGVFIGDNTAANDVGIFVEPGQTLPVPTKAALYAFNNGGSDVKVTILQLKSA